MIPILRVLVLFVFLLFAIGLAHSEREHRATYRLILAFVAFGATTFVPEEAILLQVFSGLVLFGLLCILLGSTVNARVMSGEKRGK